MAEDKPESVPAQHQERHPGFEHEMEPRPHQRNTEYRGSGKLAGRAAIITGGDSGIGRAVAILFAREGADVAVMYLDEHEDAKETKRLVEEEGRQCLLIAGDVGDKSFCSDAVEKTMREFGRLDIRVNAVAPGPIWTPLIPSSFPPDYVEEFGQDTPMGRPGQPEEVAPCYVFLASEDASYISGQTLHPNGGRIVGS